MFAPRTCRFIVACTAALLMSAPIASAQSTLPPQEGTITVSAEGTASAPADVAYISIVLNSAGYYGDPMMELVPSPPATAKIDPSPVVDALVANGVVADNAQILEGPFAGEWSKEPVATPVTLLVALDAPTPERINEILTVSRDAAGSTDVLINSFNVMYGIENCAPLREEARRNAVDNARTEASAQASAMDVQLGNAVASRDVVPMGPGSYQVSSCTPNMSTEVAVRTYMMMPFDPSQPAEVHVIIGLEVMFDLQ